MRACLPGRLTSHLAFSRPTGYIPPSIRPPGPEVASPAGGTGSARPAPSRVGSAARRAAVRMAGRRPRRRAVGRSVAPSRAPPYTAPRSRARPHAGTRIRAAVRRRVDASVRRGSARRPAGGMRSALSEPSDAAAARALREPDYIPTHAGDPALVLHKSRIAGGCYASTELSGST